jgi:hypothetical protein
LGQILILVIALRVLLGLIGALSLAVNGQQPAGGDWASLALTPNQPEYYVVGPWQRWDALWYQKIATSGYAADDSSTAFFPLFPALTRLVGTVLGGDVALGGLAVATLAFIGALAFMRRLVTRDFGTPVAERTLWYLALFPTAFFFLAPYTESIFLLTALMAIYGARSGRWRLASLGVFLGGLARAQGIFLLLPVLYEYFRQNRWSKGTFVRGLLLTLSSLGWVAYMLYATMLSGHGPDSTLLFWGYRVTLPWDALSQSVQMIIATGSTSEALNLAALLLFTVGAIVGLWLLPFSYSLYVIPQLLLLATRTMYFSPLMSASRYVLPLFPIFILLALYTKSRWQRLRILIVFVLLLSYYFYSFVHWNFVA